MKSLTSLAIATLKELGGWCAVSTDHDAKTVCGRIKHEGESFLTISLASFGKSFEQALELQRITPNLFSPTWRMRGGVPVFLRGFLELVFDCESGVILDVPSVDAIRAVRQFCLMFAKIEMECSFERTTQAFTQYIETDKEVGEHSSNLDDSHRLDFERMARRLWSDLLSRLDYRVQEGDITPKHGPGATANRVIGNKKYSVREWSLRLERQFPWLENGAASWSQYQEEVTFLSPAQELPVRVVSVPKTQTTPRIIAIEPSYMQYMQQGILEAIVQEIRAHHWARSFICFDSQVPNQVLARQGSRDGSLATLDLKEASDRVSLWHVAALLRGHSPLRKAVFACRSTKATVLEETYRLNKFASMGSALTFPMEALVFTTIVFLGLERAIGHHLSHKEINSFVGRVRIFGDDIIVPTDAALSVIETLEEFGLVVNRSKSFLNGKFRESCGEDYFDGIPVKVIRVRQPLPQSRRDAKQVESLSSLRNQLANAGFVDVVSEIDKLLLEVLSGHYPFVRDSTGVIGRVSQDTMPALSNHYKFDSDLQRILVRGYALDSPLPSNSLEGYDALLKFFLKRSEDPLEKDHLSRSGRPKTVRLKLRWAAL